MNCFTKKLHTVTLQKIHKEDDAKSLIPSYLATQKVLSFDQIGEFNKIEVHHTGKFSIKEKVAKKLHHSIFITKKDDNSNEVINYDIKKLNAFINDVESVAKIEHLGVDQILSFSFGDGSHSATLLLEFIPLYWRDSKG